MKIFFLVTLCMIMNQDYKALRKKMVEEQIINRGITSQKVVDAMLTVPRHEFVPEEYKHLAYNDSPLPIGYNQTISQPYIVGYMTEKLELNKNQKVLEIGTGSGYQAAILSQLANSVYTIEIIKPLGETARERLTKLKYNNVKVKIGDGYKGWKQYAPYDAIIVTAAPESVPLPLIEQLKDGGTMIIPIGPQGSTQYLQLLEKKDGKLEKKKLLPVRFVPFTRDSNGGVRLFQRRKDQIKKDD
ncbi:MAG: protein-L-isoaspartate(D-aspartate) O-methyltransferase [Marinilabiliaceae bacterium]|nr:protein-L-isoaspartate(D-aspartate) O-methyltransferase [Marinilabiliaceae bacterium]